MAQPDIVAKLWHLCNILRESGITYPEYVTELTYLLFLKMAKETGSEKGLPQDYRWQHLAEKKGDAQLKFYARLLRELGTSASSAVRKIFADSQTCLSQTKHLHLLVAELNEINWYEAKEEGALADVYEGLLEKNSSESKSGAGQYFTPRVLIEAIVQVTKPRRGESIQDPACGTGGFLIAAARFVKSTSPIATESLGPRTTFFGVELVRDTHRLALMNAMLHGITGRIECGDGLGEAGAELPPADLILTNPPFGTKRGGGLPSRAFPIPTSNKQLAFLQHIYMGLKPGGRAAVVMPDLQGSTASAVCADLMDRCRLHTILRLPTGIFYAAGVKTNVLFFERGRTLHGNTKEVWVFDLRTGMPVFGKRTPFTREHLTQFEKAYGPKANGKAGREPSERFRMYTRDEVKLHGDTLDLSWMPGDAASAYKNLPNPQRLLANVVEKLQAALEEMQSLERKLAP